MAKQDDFRTFIKAAKSLIVSEIDPNYEAHFNTVGQFSPILGQLEQILWVVDFARDKFIYMSPNAKDVNGYSQDECIRMGPSKFMELLHERDFEIISNELFVEGVALAKTIPDYHMSRFRISYSYRLRQKDGSYSTLMNQFSPVMEDEERNPLVIMGTTSNISEIHTKPELFCRIHYQNKKGNWEKILERFYKLNETKENIGLTPREMEIIRFVQAGKSTKEIAALTNRSEETIKSQRKSILAKTNCQSMTDVVIMALNNHWV